MSALHNLMMLDHVQEKLAMSRQHLDHYRRQGLKMPEENKAGAEEMKILSTGDVHLTAPQVSPPQQEQKQSSGLGKVLAGAAIGAALLGVPAAGVGGFMLNRMLQTKPVASPVSEDQSLDLGLLQFEDLKTGAGQ